MPGESKDLEKGLGIDNTSSESHRWSEHWPLKQNHVSDLGSQRVQTFEHAETSRHEPRSSEDDISILSSVMSRESGDRNGSQPGDHQMPITIPMGSHTHQRLDIGSVDAKIMCPPAEYDGQPTLTAGEWAVKHHQNGLLVRVVEQPKSQPLGWFRHVTEWIFQWAVPSLIISHAAPATQERRGSEYDHGPSQRFYRISLAEMHRMHLRKLQIRLAKHAIDMYATGEETPAPWEADLAEYVQALRDADYILDSSISRPRDNFIITGERRVDNNVMSALMRGVNQRNPEHVGLWDNPRMRTYAGAGPLEADSKPIGDTRSNMGTLVARRGFQNRILLGFIGGALLIGPMWLMVLQSDRWTGLVTTTACVLVFVVVTSLKLERPMEVLSATAAYAAVLVVFVGLTVDDV